MDSYTEELEMRLRFAEEDAQERERIAYEQGREDAIEELLEKTQDWKDNGGSFIDFQRLLRKLMKGEEE